ncbi:methyltransferase domain-containing protein [Psychromonas ossibalaenae]|uniref:methyltransferase domain-containing protein n=1 Tax=Psychromonas ossibalaenae TaxID=444922 RepID=UPI00036F5880|nr:methyltransferase domain-containing protein [Psychromonas ossibalaenae]
MLVHTKMINFLFQRMFGNNFSRYGLLKETLTLDFNSVLDIGFGKGAASLFYAINNKNVTSIGLALDSYSYPKYLLQKYSVNCIETTFESFSQEKQYDLVLASHVLEHTLSPGLFLEKARTHLNDSGYLFIIVPPFKESIVGGHVTNGWTLAQLIYNLLLNGYDVKNGHFYQDDKNICAIVQKSNQILPMLRMDEGDLEVLRAFWPCEIRQGTVLRLKDINWFKNSYEITDKDAEKFLYYLEDYAKDKASIGSEERVIYGNMLGYYIENTTVEDAFHSYKKNDSLSNFNVVDLYRLGLLLFKDGMLNEAKSIFYRTTTLNSNKIKRDSLYKLAQIYFSQENYEQALDFIENILLNFPNKPGYFAFKTMVLLKLKPLQCVLNFMDTIEEPIIFQKCMNLIKSHDKEQLTEKNKVNHRY